MEQEKPNYYAIIPAEVRYDKDLRAGAKIFYGEITALCSKNGVCTASNNYFAELYSMTPSGITHWVTQLKEKGYIDVTYERDGNQITKRNIILKPFKTKNKVVEKVLTNVNRVVTNVNEGNYKNTIGYLQKDKENNTSINNTSINNNTYSVTEKQYEEFMEEYPKKTKTESVKRWFALNKPSETFFKILIDKVKEFKEYECKGKELRYIPDALTWLNEKRFKDEYKPKEIVQEVKTSKYSQTTPKNAKFESSREYTQEEYESFYDD